MSYEEKIHEYEVRAFGEELAELNRLPKEQRYAYLERRWREFDTPHDREFCPELGLAEEPED
jgi:hypothetical protein